MISSKRRAYNYSVKQMIILTLKPEEPQKTKRNFFKRKVQNPVFTAETIFINSFAHYKISAEPRCFCDEEFLAALKCHKGQIAATDEVLAIARANIEPLLFDTSGFSKHCAFSGLMRFLKGNALKNESLFIKDSQGALNDVLQNALPLVKALFVISDARTYGEQFKTAAFLKYGAAIKVISAPQKAVCGCFADFDALASDGSLFLAFNEKRLKIRPEIIRKKTEGAAVLRTLGINEKYIYSAFY